MKGICVRSEIEPLKKVLLHRPGRELLNLTPDRLPELLFDDIPFLEVAQQEHDAFAQILRDNGVEHAYATGSIAEVLADVNDRLSGQTRQMSNSIGWSKDIFEMRLEQDSLRLQVGAQLDSLERSFNRIVVVAEHVPEISDRVLEELNRQVTQLIGTMNASIDNAFAGFDRQRDELQRYVTREREALVEQLRQTGDDLVRTTLDAVPGLVGKVLLYLVLALAVLIGGPFALGFWLGGVRQRAKSRIKDEELKMKN